MIYIVTTVQWAEWRDTYHPFNPLLLVGGLFVASGEVIPLQIKEQSGWSLGGSLRDVRELKIGTNLGWDVLFQSDFDTSSSAEIWIFNLLWRFETPARSLEGLVGKLNGIDYTDNKASKSKPCMSESLENRYIKKRILWSFCPQLFQSHLTQSA